MSAQASVQDNVFNEQASVTAPGPPYAYSGGDWNASQTMTAGGLHLVTSSVQMTGGKGIYTILLSGNTSAQASNSIDGTKFQAGAGSGASLDGGAKPFNIQLVQPNPNTDPTLGDGTNQFVYSADTPDGYLYIPGAIQVVGGTHADAQFLLDNNLVDLKIENSPVPNTFVHQWAISGNTIYVNTPQNTDDPYPGYQFNHWIFKGLPSSFSTVADGNHNVNLYVQGAKAQTAKIQTFFNMKISNWPMTNGYDPNWFHYYQKAYTPPQPDIEPVRYNADLGARGVTTIGFETGTTNPNAFTYDVEVGPNAPDDDIIYVFGIDPETNHVQKIGGLSIKGIYCFARVISHEEEHVHLVKQQIVVPYNSQTGPPYGVTDSDGDGIPDSWEAAHHLNPLDNDTTGEYANATGNNAGKGDVECLCDIFALGELSAHQSLWQQDWGVIDAGGSQYSGLQYGKRSLYFPWQYIDDASYSISVSLPSNALKDLP